MFVDSAIITVRAGNGGRGAATFRREKFDAKGGPSGGDGGRGGDVILRADEGLNTLLDFRGRPEWEAPVGEDGRKKQQHGSDGLHLHIRVPAGTLVYDQDSGDLLADIKPGEEVIVARGGFGGFGNEHYKSATNQTPMYAHPGQSGEVRVLRLELKLLADVGLVGLPNAGKSTLLAALTRANPKIAAYPFTTLSPQLGVAELDPSRRLVIADIPGLIEGASEGAGLGLEFLKHIERTKVLVHLLDVMPPDSSDPAENYRTIRKELAAYSKVLAERREIIGLNKLDLLPNEAERNQAVDAISKRLQKQFGKRAHVPEVLPLSGAAKFGTKTLLERLWKIVSLQRLEDARNEQAQRTQEAVEASMVELATFEGSTKPTRTKARSKKPLVKKAPSKALAKAKAKPAAKAGDKAASKSKPKAKAAAKPAAKKPATKKPATKAAAKLSTKPSKPATKRSPVRRFARG
jgi:GTPase